MADYNSSLPVRTETAGDVIIKVADSLIPSQQVQVTAARELSVLASAQPGVDIGDVTVNNGSGGAAVNIQDGGNSITVDATDLDIRDLSSATDSITVVATDLDIRDLDSATDSVTVIATDLDIRDLDSATDSVTVVATNLDIRDLSSATDSVTVIQGTTPWSENIAEIAGAAPSASNSLPVQLTDGAAFYSDSNPLPVKFSQEGTPVNDFKQASAIAVGASDSHDYVALGAFSLNQIEASGSGKAKMAVAIETGVATGIFTTKFVQFNSTAETNMSITLSDPIAVAIGVRVRVTMTNRDLLAQDLYSTISGLET